MVKFLQRACIVIVFSFLVQDLNAQRKMERLGRGVIATRTGTSKILVSWRLLGTEPQDIGFNLYRSAAGGTPIKLNSAVLTAGTNFEDQTATLSIANTYTVKTVYNGVEKDAGAGYTLPANTVWQPFIKIPIRNVATHEVRYVFTGDLDGDGEFDYVVHKWPRSGVDWAVTPDLIEAYKSDGSYLWTINGGPNSYNRNNISPGSSALNCGHGDNITVYDINNDGKAEVIMRTANGVAFASGSVIVDSDNRKQFLSVINGVTGSEISRTLYDNPYIQYGPMNGHFGIAYLDGINPSLVWEAANRNTATGGFQEMVTTWDWNGSTLVQKWRFNLMTAGQSIPSGHQFKIFDIDGDGKDEIVPQAYALDDDGTLMYNLLDQAIDHGDRFSISDLDPSRPGLELYGIQQGYSKLGIMWYYCDAKTGKVLLSQSSPKNTDMGRGMTGDFDPRYAGSEFHTFVEGLYNVSGAVTSTGIPASYPNMRIFWDGDLGSENLDNGKFTKWNYLTNSESRLLTISGVTQNDRTTPALYGDLFGDWREEAVYESADHNFLVIYTSPNFTTTRIYTLPHNPGYRSDMAVRGYYQSHNPDFYLGHEMQQPPIPAIQTANAYWVGNTSVWDKSLANWTNGTNPKVFADGDTIMFDVRGANADTVRLNTNVSPGKVWAINGDGKNYVVGGTGKLSGVMELWKAKEGIFTLKGNHDYTGATVITEGQFNIDGSLASPVIIKGLGAIGGRGTLAGGIVMDKSVSSKGGKISPGFGNSPTSLGTLTIAGDLSLTGDNVFEFDIVPGSARVNDSLKVSGNLTVAGSNKLNVKFSNDNFVPGTYTLIRSNGTLTASLNNFVLDGVYGVSKELIIENNEVKLRIKTSRNPGNVVWSGATNSSWDFDTKNFSLRGVQEAFVSKDTVTFDATATQKSIVLSETVLPSSLTFNSSADYTIQGPGVIAGTTGVLKTNTNNVSILNTSNTYTGPTIINGGTLSVSKIGLKGEPSSIGAGGDDAANIQINNATLIVTEKSTTDRVFTISSASTINVPNAASYMIFNADVKGTGSFIKDGAGEVFMIGAKTFSGPVVIKSGKLNLRTIAGNNGGLGTSKDITIENATLSLDNIEDTYSAPAWNLTVPEGKIATLNAHGRSNMTGTLSGAGTLNLNIPYIRTTFNGNWSAFTGQVNIAGGDFRVGNTFGYQNVAINITAGSIYPTTGGGTSISIGELSGTASAYASGYNWTVGAKNTDAVYSGRIVSTSLTKVGTGTFILNGNNYYTGATTVNAGRLLVNNSGATRGAGSGAVVVSNGAVLGGTGGIKGPVTVNSGGTLQPGSDAIGRLKDSTSVTFASGSIAEMEISKSGSAVSFDVLSVTGAVTFNGKLVIRKLGTAAFAAGDSFKLFEASSYTGDFSSIEPQVPGANLVWQFTPTTGTLSVIATSSPQTITFPSIGSKVVGDPDFNPGATASSGLPVSYTSSEPAVATIVNGQIHIVSAGTTIITALQGGDASFDAAANVTQTLVVLAPPPFNLPAKNFKISVTDETCASSNNGKIRIEATAALNYKVKLNGSGTEYSLTSSAPLEISNLAAGNYEVCITVDEKADYKFCAPQVNITEPAALSVYSSVNADDKTVYLSLSGGNSYEVELNGQTYKTTSNTFTLTLADGKNDLIVRTDKSCQGIFTKSLVLDSKEMIFPNPFDETLFINFGGHSSGSAKISIYSFSGSQVYLKEHNLNSDNIALNLSSLIPGTYIIKIKTNQSESSSQIIKK